MYDSTVRAYTVSLCRKEGKTWGSRRQPREELVVDRDAGLLVGEQQRSKGGLEAAGDDVRVWGRCPHSADKRIPQQRGGMAQNTAGEHKGKR
jgi:hypothetical protein